MHNKNHTSQKIDWTGATWFFTEGRFAGHRVTITGLKVNRDFGQVWVGQVDCGAEVIFTKESMGQNMDLKTRKPYGTGACA